MTIIHKAVAAVVRRNGSGAELLAFAAPLAGVSAAEGHGRAGQRLPAEGVLRELEEESGSRLEVRAAPGRRMAARLRQVRRAGTAASASTP